MKLSRTQVKDMKFVILSWLEAKKIVRKRALIPLERARCTQFCRGRRCPSSPMLRISSRVSARGESSLAPRGARN